MNIVSNFVFFSYEFDRMSNSGSARNYRDAGYQQQYPQQQRGDNYNNQQSRRSNNFASGNGSRGRRGIGGNLYRGGTQSDAGTGGKCNLKKFCFQWKLSHMRNKDNNIYLHRRSQRVW